jgi:predicted enzyme related to lactoylglutathione lyase
MIQSLAFILYPATDLAATRRFYESTLGLRLAHDFGGQWFEYDLGNATFAIAAADAEHPAPVAGAVVAFEVDDVDAAAARLKALGVDLPQAVVETPVCRFLTLRDPSGNEVLLHQRRAP